MAAIVNDRDVLIMSAVPRYAAATNSSMALLPPAAVFKKSASGLSATPSSFVFKATLLNLAGTVSFSWTSGLSFVVNGNEATLNYASDMAASGSLTASITVDGVVYSQTSTITTLADGLPGTPGLNSPPQTATQLKDTLIGALTADQFVSSLQSTIGLITAPAATAGSVAAQVKAEADARSAAISAEVTNRGAAINAAMAAEVGARNAAIVNYGYTKEASDQSLAQFGATITAAYKTYTDGKSAQALTDANAFTRSWGYSIADANSAIAASASTLQANINSAVSTAKAYTESWGYSKAQIDQAEIAQFNQLTTNYQGYANGVGQAATSASDAAMRSYTMAKSDITSAIATNSSALTTNYTNAINAVAVAGRNVVPDSAFERGLRPWTTKSAYVSRVAVLGSVGAKYLFIESTSATGPDNDAYVNGDGPPIPVTPGTQYVIAFDYATAQASSITNSSCYMYLSSGGGFGMPLPVLDTGSVRVRAVMIWTCPAGVTSIAARFGIHTTGYAWMAVYNILVAPGNKDPGYSPSAEDGPALAAAAQTGAIAAAAADVRGYTMAKSDITGAIATATTSLTSSFQSADASNLTAAKSYADSAITNYTYSKSDINGAIAGSSNAITARLNNIGGATIEQTISAQASAITGLHASWSVKLDVNGNIAGIILAGDSTGGTSTFGVVADKFALKYPGLNSLIPFAVGMVNGQSVIGLNGTVVIDGSLTARTLAAGAVTATSLAIGNADNVLPDSNMLDAKYWNRAEGAFSTPGSPSFWKSTRILSIGPNDGYVDSFTPFFPVARGATYLFEFQVFLTNDYAGPSSLFAHLPGQAWFQMGAPSRGYNFKDVSAGWETLPVMFDGGSPRGTAVYSQMVTLNDNADAGRVQFRLITACWAGVIQLGGIRVTRVTDATILGPGVVQTKHLDIATGGDIHSGQQGFDLGDGFWLEGEGRGHGARMSIGRQNGRKIIIDPANNRLELVDPQIGAKMTASISPSQYAIQRNSNQQFTNVFVGTFTASAGNASSNLSYSWSVSSGSSEVVANLSSTNGAQISVYASGRGTSGQEFDISVNCNVVDLNNGVSRQVQAFSIIQIP